MTRFQCFVAFLPFTFSILLDSGAIACDLIPENNLGSCLELKSRPNIISASSLFGPNIEGASVNPKGEIFAVDYGNPAASNSLGQMYPKQRLFYSDTLPSSLFNGIRFLNQSVAFVVDAVNHRVLQLGLSLQNDNTVVTSSRVFCSDQEMLQPNDLTLSVKAGTILLSGMRSEATSDNKDGDIWACLSNGQAKRLELMGMTNGIDLSPDETILYVSECYNEGGVPYVQKIWKYDLNVEKGVISNKTLFVDFGMVDGSVRFNIDGMRTDIKGNLYVTRHGGSQIVIFSPNGKVVGKIAVNFPKPTNLEFGGPKGTTLFIVGQCKDSENKGCVDTIEVAHPGRSWSLLQ